MAKQRQISDRFWYDPYIAEELTEPDEKLLFLYLLTNQYVSIAGIYEISIRTINFDTSIPTPRIKEILAKLSQAEKVHYDMGYVILANYHKYVSYNIPQVRNYVKQVINALPSHIQDQYSDVINNVIALANPLPSPRQPLKNSENQENPSPGQVQGKPKSSPTQGQPDIPIPIPIPTNTNTSTSFPPTPQGEPRVEKYILGRDGHAMLNPEWKEGREGKEEISNSSGEGKEAASPGGRKGRDDDTPIEVAPGVWLSENQCRKIRQEYGDDALIEVPDQVSEWAEKKNITVKDSFKMCEKFAKKFVEAQNG